MNAQDSVQYMRSIGLDLCDSNQPVRRWKLMTSRGTIWAEFDTLSQVWNFMGSIAWMALIQVQTVEEIMVALERDQEHKRKMYQWLDEDQSFLPAFAMDIYKSVDEREASVPDNWEESFQDAVAPFGRGDEPILTKLLRKRLLDLRACRGALSGAAVEERPSETTSDDSVAPLENEASTQAGTP